MPSADGKRFLFSVPSEISSTPTSITLVLNWQPERGKQFPALGWFLDHEKYKALV
jgi:hypothetical protein